MAGFEVITEGLDREIVHPVPLFKNLSWPMRRYATAARIG
jgi:hypothetical protein